MPVIGEIFAPRWKAMRYRRGVAALRHSPFYGWRAAHIRVGAQWVDLLLWKTGCI